jgi:protocatechuate 3,4-dioxygenase beta subunit
LTFLCLGIALLSSVAVAQTTSGTITGTVTDQSGAVVPGAKILLTDEATKDTREATGGDSGDFVFAALRPGTYAISV